MINPRHTGMKILRIVMGFIMLKDFIIYFINARSIFSREGIVPYSLYERLITFYHLNFLKFPFDSYYNLFCLGGILCSILFIINYKTFTSGLILLIMVNLIKFRCIYILDGADNLMWVLLPFVLLYQPETSFKNFKLNNIKRYLNILLPYAVMIQVCILYFSAAYHKLPGDLWHSGTAIFYILRVDEFRVSFLNVFLTKSKLFVFFLTYMTLVWEGLFPFFAFFKRTKTYLFLVSVLMHIGIFIFMRIDNYSFIAMGTYAVFFTNSELKNIFAKPLQFFNPYVLKLGNSF